MKLTVIFGGASCSINTETLLSAFLRGLGGQIEALRFNAYDLNAAPCIGCDTCASGECVYHDLDPLWESIKTSNAIVVASPVYFCSFPAPLKAIIDRMQVFWRGNPLPGERKLVLLAAAGAPSSTANDMLHALKWLHKPLGCTFFGSVVANGTDKSGLRECFLQEAREMAARLTLSS